MRHLLFATGYGHLPDVTGGLQTTLHELCLALESHGIKASVLCGFAATSDRSAYMERSDNSSGYQVIRTEDPIGALPTITEALDPDAVIVLTGNRTAAMIAAALGTDRPIAAYLHNVEFREFGGILLPDNAICYFANSHFTAKRLQALFGIDSTLLYPLVQPELYKVATSREKILFINPSLIKGAEIFFRLAQRLADVPFRVYESWNLPPAWKEYCRERAAECGNVEWCPPTRNIQHLYGSARILIMPSIWEEAFGRSAVEAQVNSIPVIASRRGGLPEAVGKGGILLDMDADIESWYDAVYTLYTDETMYRDLCTRALANVQQNAFAPDTIVNTLITTLQIHAAGAS